MGTFRDRARHCASLQFVVPALIAMFGCGPQLDPAPPQPLDIGQTYVGTIISKTGTWRNSGTANATIAQPALVMAGANANVFAGALMGAVPATVAPNRTLAPPVVIAFAPTAVGQFTATAIPAVQEANATVNAMTVQGEGIAQINRGSLVLGGQPLTMGQPVNLGRVRVGATSPIVTLNLQNTFMPTGNVRVTKVQLHNNNQGFIYVGPQPPFNIPQGGTVAVQLRFRPPAFPNPPLEKKFHDGITFFEVQTDTLGNITASASGTALCGVGFHPSENPPQPPMTCP